MTKAKLTSRTYPGGAAAAVMPYTIKLHLDASTLASGNTSAAGEVDYAPNLSPGPWYATVTDSTPDPDAVRVVSTKSTDSGGAYSLAELPMVLRAIGHGVTDGYLNELAVTYDGAGLDLTIATGAAMALGIPTVVSATANPSVTSTRDVTNPKQCYLVLEFTGIGQTEEGKVVAKDVCGTAAASPTLPALTQTDVLWQEPLATFRLPNTGSTVLTQVTDARAFLLTRNPVVSSVVRRTDPASATATSSTTGEDISGMTTTVTLLSGVVYDIEAHALVLAKAAAGQTVSIAPYINGTFSIATYVASSAVTDYMAIGNVHILGAVTGAGTTISCGVYWKTSGGTASAITGYLLIVATPRT